MTSVNFVKRDISIEAGSLQAYIYASELVKEWYQAPDVSLPLN